jgi:hypothetical protein
MRKMHEILALVCGFLNRQKIGYVLVGGIVVSIHGIPRSTVDADMILNLEGKALPVLVRFLKRNGFTTSLADAQAAFAERSHFTAEDTLSSLRLDIKGIYNEMDRNAYERRVRFRFKGFDMMIQTPEDLIAAKLGYGSEQDIRDAEGVYITKKGKLDLEYLKTVCRSYGVSKELGALVKRAGRKR